MMTYVGLGDLGGTWGLRWDFGTYVGLGSHFLNLKRFGKFHSKFLGQI